MWFKLTRIFFFFFNFCKEHGKMFWKKKVYLGRAKVASVKTNSLMLISANKATIKWLLYQSVPVQIHREATNCVQAVVGFDKPKPEEGYASDFFMQEQKKG